ncbi:MAG TPA: hypothetical protein VIV57_08535 [Anaeromyxobacter sp.]
MTTTALAPRAAPSLYSGMILALIGLALVLQVSFVAGLAQGRGGFAPRPPAVSEVASLPTPCAIP